MQGFRFWFKSAKGREAFTELQIDRWCQQYGFTHHIEGIDGQWKVCVISGIPDSVDLYAKALTNILSSTLCAFSSDG